MDINLCYRIGKIRLEKGLNKREFADILEIPGSIISDIENCKREPSKDILHKLSDKFSISLNWLYYGAGPKHLAEACIEEKHPLVSNIETLIKDNLKEVESRLTSLENKFEYTVATGGESYCSESEPEYVALPLAGDTTAVPDNSLIVKVPLRFIKTKLSNYYAIRVKDNSMIDALIPDGSLAIIRKSTVPVNGKIQLVLLDNRATFKRLRQEEDKSWTLCYEDGTGRTAPLGDIPIQGDFVAVLPPLNRPQKREE